MRVAVVGSGISGLAAAASQHPWCHLTVYESSRWLGGHAHTVDVQVEGRTVPVDLGFIVFNEPNYPGFRGLLAGRDVQTQRAPMSFSISDGASLEARFSSASALLASPGNAARPSFLRLLTDIVRFNRQMRGLLDQSPPWAGADRLPGDGTSGSAPWQPGPTLAEIVHGRGYGPRFVADFLVPFGSAIWSAQPGDLLDMPAASYARFMANHGLLGVRAKIGWQTISGGSRQYVQALSAPFADRIRLGTPVRAVTPTPGGVRVQTDVDQADFDHVVIASHSDTALAMLTHPTTAQQQILGSIRYRPNSVVLHMDPSVMPRRRRAWAAWNARLEQGSDRVHGAHVTYWMNHLQSLPVRTPLLVSLNMDDQIDPRLVLARRQFAHPILDTVAVAAQQRRFELPADGIHFAGAYLGYGFHEDGAQAGLAAAQEIVAQARQEVAA